jgi:type II secretory pathway predicted ATPase ExeA
MYETFFGLKERPFDLSPNPKYLFLAPTQKEALSMLRYGLTSGRGITLLLGEAGTGKTTLLQTVLAEIGPETAQCVLLSNPTLSRAEFYEFLSDGFGMNGGTNSKTKFLADFREHLEQRHRRGLVTALLLDEAQSLPSELLEEVRLLSNIETTTDKLLNVLLIGQPELADRLNESGLRQLKQRVALRWEIRTFSLAETAAYIAGRLRIAGGVPADVFSRDSITTVYRLSNGVPRVINVICDNALIGGFAARTKPVTKALVDDVCRDFDFRSATQPVLVERQAPAAGPAHVSSPDASVREAGGDVASTVNFGPFRPKKRFSFFQSAS